MSLNVSPGQKKMNAARILFYFFSVSPPKKQLEIASFEIIVKTY